MKEGQIMRRMAFALVSVAALVGMAAPVSAQSQQAGVSAAVRGQVALARASASIVGQQVQSGDPIFLGDAITSGKDSGMQVMLLDETVFTIGPNSEISIDEFVYDPATSSGKVVASVAKGAFRFITGKIAQKRPEDMTVRLPTATIGIRGTIVAGVVRGAPGENEGADAVFDQLENDFKGAKDARDFVILLGPGDENNTNDSGGAFVFTANPPQQAQSGVNAGEQLAQTPPASALDVASITVSRRGSAAVGFEDGDPQGPFFVSDFVRFFSRVFPADTQGTKPADDPGAQETSETSSDDAGELSGNDTAEASGLGEQAAQLSEGAQRGDDIIDPSAGSGSNTFDFDDLRQITSGTASSSQNLNLGPFQLSGSLNINFGDPHIFFSFSISCATTCTDFSSGSIVTSPFINYANSTGPAIFTNADPAVINSGDCASGCDLTIAITSASAAGPSATANVSFDHEGEGGSQSTNIGN